MHSIKIQCELFTNVMPKRCLVPNRKGLLKIFCCCVCIFLVHVNEFFQMHISMKCIRLKFVQLVHCIANCNSFMLWLKSHSFIHSLTLIFQFPLYKCWNDSLTLVLLGGFATKTSLFFTPSIFQSEKFVYFEITIADGLAPVCWGKWMNSVPSVISHAHKMNMENFAVHKWTHKQQQL